MIVAYLAMVMAVMAFSYNAGLGKLQWERNLIIFIIVAPTVLFCATYVGAFVLYAMLILAVEMVRSIPAQQRVEVFA